MGVEKTLDMPDNKRLASRQQQAVRGGVGGGIEGRRRAQKRAAAAA